MHPFRIFISALPFTFAFALGLGACSMQEPVKTSQVDIEPYLIPCGGWEPGPCITGTREFKAGEIEGFKFQWGQRQRITIETHTLHNPPEDGGTYRHVMVRADAKAATPDWEFRTMPMDTIVYSLKGDTLSIWCYPAVLIPDAADQALIAARTGARISLRIRPVSPDGILLGDSVQVIPHVGS
jgi:hypothetical protein